MRLTLPRILAVVVVILIVVGCVVLLTAPGNYRATAFLPAGNPKLLEGAGILVNGFQKGEIESLLPKGEGAELIVSVDSDVAPLHTGAVVFVQWSATVGERLIQINDGPRTNPEIPDGGRIEGNMPKPMEIGDVLAGLDPKSRARLGPLAQQLRTALAGSEQDLNATLRTAGPAFTAIGNLTKGLAIDGPALNQLVTDTNALVGRIANRSEDLSTIINDLSISTRDAASVRTQLRQTLQKLPPTLNQAQSTLAKVPDTVDATVPLLNDLKPATDKLPSVASNLAPLLQDLRPTIAELKPTLKALDELLGVTPGLLDDAKSTVPKLTDTFDKLTPTAKSVRPFTPCLIGFLTNNGSAAAYAPGQTPLGAPDRQQYVRILVRAGSASLNEVGAPLPVPMAAFGNLIPRTCDPQLQGLGGGGATTSPAALANPAAALTGGLN